MQVIRSLTQKFNLRVCSRAQTRGQQCKKDANFASFLYCCVKVKDYSGLFTAAFHHVKKLGVVFRLFHFIQNEFHRGDVVHFV